MIRSWIGTKQIAFIPVWNAQVDQQPPEDWVTQVRERAFYDPDPNTLMDRSLQRYIQTVSSGKASIGGRVLPVVRAPDEDVIKPALDSLPNNHGFDYALIVIPHSVGPHRGGFAWMNETPINGISARARVAMFSDQAMTDRRTLGVWAHELLHIVTWLGDLYNTSPQIGGYDIMACGCGTHPSSESKNSFGWIDNGGIETLALGQKRSFSLHAASLPQPAPSWRRTAIRVASRTTPGYFMIEVRLRTDNYEAQSVVSSGIPAEGVIVYEVQGPSEIYLRTNVPLGVGDTLDIPNEKLNISVTAEESGGFRVRIDAGKVNRCVQLSNQIEVLELSLQFEVDINIRKQLISELQKSRSEFRRLGCLIHNPGDSVFLDKFFGVNGGEASNLQDKDPTCSDLE